MAKSRSDVQVEQIESMFGLKPQAKAFYVAYTDQLGEDSDIVYGANEREARAAFKKLHRGADIDFVEEHAGYEC